MKPNPVNLLTLAGSGLSAFLLARRILRDRDVPPVAFLNSFAHLPLLSAPPLFIAAILTRRPGMAAAFAGPTVGSLVNYGANLRRGLGFGPVPTPPTPGTTTFRVMTWNVHKEARDLTPMVKLIREARPDILALQELSAAAADCFTSELADLLPHSAVYPQDDYPSAGQGILSRFPIHDSVYWRHSGIPNALGHQRAVLDIDDRPVAFYNAHPVHPGMVDRVFDAAPRHDEIGWLLERVGAEHLPVILVGDLNLTDQSDDYRRLTLLLRDAFRETGHGMGFTYPDWSAPHSRSVVYEMNLPEFLPHLLIPILRLDFVMFTSALRAFDSAAWPDSGGSDHRPVIAQLGFV